MSYQVQDNIPRPGKTERSGRNMGAINKTAIVLNVGQSFLVPDRSVNTVNSILATARKNTGYKYKCATDGVGTRVWRIE